MLGIERERSISGFQCSLPVPTVDRDGGQEGRIGGVVGIEPDGFASGRLRFGQPVLSSQYFAPDVVAEG
jgi:hypothetical protein